MPYTKIFQKPYPNGYKDRPDTSTPETAAILDAKDAAFEHIENYLHEQKVSDLQNDLEFVKQQDMGTELAKKADKQTTYTKDEVNALLPDNMDVIEDLSDEDGKLAYKGEVVGGGGNANEREISWADYQKLSEAEKMNGTNYYVPDAPSGSGGGGSSSMHEYSTEEHVVGKWIDGKPLYERTWYVTGLPQGSLEYFSNVIVEDAEIYFIYDGFLFQDGSYCPLGTTGNPNNYDVSITSFVLNTGRMWLVRGSGSLSDLYITVRYTKTTD